jgi:hypothetical protein
MFEALMNPIYSVMMYQLICQTTKSPEVDPTKPLTQQQYTQILRTFNISEHLQEETVITYFTHLTSFWKNIINTTTIITEVILITYILISLSTWIVLTTTMLEYRILTFKTLYYTDLTQSILYISSEKCTLDLSGQRLLWTIIVYQIASEPIVDIIQQFLDLRLCTPSAQLTLLQ